MGVITVVFLGRLSVSARLLLVLAVAVILVFTTLLFEFRVFSAPTAILVHLRPPFTEFGSPTPHHPAAGF